jgi:hypothetical protein
MLVQVVEARAVGNFRVWLKFNDGLAGEIDLADELDGKVFEPLRDVTYFASFRLEGHTLTWPNGADMAPEFLHEQVKAAQAA